MSLRELEAASIRAFLTDNAHLLGGRVLDYGAGASPYGEIVRAAGGDYQPFDRSDFPASVVGAHVYPGYPLKNESWDAILVTQVMQYVPNPTALLGEFFALLKHGGHLVMTGKTNWPIVEKEDLFGWTPSGAAHAVGAVGFAVLESKSRAEVRIEGEPFSIGFGLTARRPNCIIYALCEPTTGEPRYVGQTTVPLSKRLRGHLHFGSRNPDSPFRAWLHGLNGAVPRIKPLECDPLDPNEAERSWYMRLVREGYDILNRGVGGTSQVKRTYPNRKPMPEEQRQKVSEQFLGKTKSESQRIRISVANTGRPGPMKGKQHSQETKQKIGEAGRGQKRTDESRARIAASKIGRMLTDEEVQAIRASTDRAPEAAKRFNLSQPTILRIRRRESWAWVPEASG